MNWWRRSIGSRVIALFLGLLLAIQLAGFMALRASLAAHARAELPARLAEGERVLQTLLDRRAQTLMGGARLLAADYGFRAALASDDGQTIVSVLANHGARIGATVSALFDPEFTLRSTTSQRPQALQPLVERLVAQAAATGTGSAVASIDGHPMQAVLVPVKAPQTIGWVLMAFPLDGQLVHDLHELSGLDVTLVQRRALADDWHAIATSAQARVAAGLAGRTPRQAVPASGAASVVADGEEFCVEVVPLDTVRAADGVDGVVALLSLSVDAAVQLPLDLQWALVFINLAGVLVFAGGSVIMTRRVTAPLRLLTASAERLGAGDFTTPIAGQRREDEIGELAQSFEQMRMDVAEQRTQILRLAYRDTLTGLPNRTRFRDATHEALSTPGTAALAVLLIDLDRYKRVNEVLGYEVGDRLLVSIAERLGRHCSAAEGALLARVGGDEFALLVPGADAQAAGALALRLAQAIDQPFAVAGHQIDMAGGIGVACWPEHANTADALLVRAEVAMVASKRKGNTAQVYDPAQDIAGARSLTLLTELRHAVEADELCLYLQPKLALHDGRLVGAEALLRWRHPQRGLIPPGQFIPFAEQTGFIRTLTRWAFDEAARLARRLQGQGIVISVNLSTRDLLDAELPQRFAATLARHGAAAASLCLEITESAIMDDPQRSLATLEGLSAMGFALSIDDFGTGYSSLAYLKRLPVDEIKIDQSFVLNMESDGEDATIVRSTIDLAHNLGLKVVAEGVETGAAWQMLRELACDQAQGYYMARPMPHEEFERWAAAHAAAAVATIATA